jgi:hypothetical protein
MRVRSGKKVIQIAWMKQEGKKVMLRIHMHLQRVRVRVATPMSRNQQ